MGLTSLQRRRTRGDGPAVNWYERARQFVTVCGYHNGKSGKITRTWFYLGDGRSAAVETARQIGLAWQKVKWNAVQQAALASQIAGQPVKPQPLWPSGVAEREKLIRLEMGPPLYRTEEVGQAADRALGTSDWDDDERSTPDFLSVGEAQRRYLEWKKGKIGLAEGGINPNSYRNVENHLKLALRINRADSGQIIPEAFPLYRIDFALLERFQDAWMQRVGDQ